MKFIGFDREDEAVAWAKKRIGLDGPSGFCRAMSAVGVDGNFSLVVVLSNFTHTNVDMHTAAVDGSMWASPRAIVEMFNALFNYVFLEHGARRVTGLVRESNVKAQTFDEHLGFVREGLMREAFSNGEALVIYGFLASEYDAHKWRRQK